MGFNIGTKIVKATGGSISRVGSHRIHQFPGEYVTDGLCLYVDTAHHDSLDILNESGHDAGTIYDLSGNGRHGTITNMPYSVINTTPSLKHNDFGGNGSTISFSHAATPYTNLLTTELLIKVMNHPGGSSYDSLWQKGSNWNATNTDAGLHFIYGSLRYHFGDHWQGNGTTHTETNLNLGNWYHIVTSSENLQGRNSRMYVNGVLVNANPCDGSAGRGPYTGPTSVADLKINYGSGGGHNGEFGLFRTYNRQLSDEEVLQNFNSIKVRTLRTLSSSNVFTFTPTCSGNKGKVEVLAVGGGGSGGNDVGGGGAGARALYNSAFDVDSNSAVSVTIGVGATSADNNVNGHGGDGGTTQFSTLSALGGNGGNGRTGTKSTAGWNGGGGSYNYATGVTPTGAGGEKGHIGGNTHNSNAEPCACGGGAGAGSVGGNGVSGKAGAGGDGVAYSISGTSKYYAGGGGGSHYQILWAGGLSGSNVGGRGSSGAEGTPGRFATSGVPRTGSGGGGGFSTGSYKSGGQGSEGCVVVRYPAEDYNIELLIVAGGGSGGSASGEASAGGGGGAGGLLYYSKVPVSSGKNYKVFVGEGADKVSATAGKNGNNSFFDDKIAIGGGAGGMGYDSNSVGVEKNAGKDGGSGGGGGSNAGTPAQGYQLGGSPTDGQGFAGGDGSDGSGADGAGGGGGAGAVGGDGVGATATAQGGAGGAGLAYSITGTSTTYAGGGGGGGATDDSDSGGGDGGAGGGGDGGNYGTVGIDATANTGGGGGGAGCRSGSNLNSGDGGTGIVIVAYKGPQRGTGGVVSTTARAGYTTHIFYGYPKDGSSGNAMKNAAHLFVA